MCVTKITNTVLLLLLIPTSTFAFDHPIIKMSIDYFMHREVKFICFLACVDKKWSQNFANNAFVSSIAVSRPTLARSSIKTGLDKCFRHKFTSIGILINANCDYFEDVLHFVSLKSVFKRSLTNVCYQRDIRNCDMVAYYGPRKKAQGDPKGDGASYMVFPFAIESDRNEEIRKRTKASQNMYFDASHKWFVIENKTEVHTTEDNTKIYEVSNNNTEDREYFKLNDEIVKETLGVLNNLTISVDADITIAKGKGLYYDIYEVFNFGKVQGDSLIVKKMGTWSREEGFTANFNAYKYYRRWDFQQFSMRLVAVIAPPPKIFYPDMITGNPPAPGVPDIVQTATIIINEVAEMHNIRFNYTITDRWLSDFSLNSSKVAASSLYFRTQDITPVLRFLPEIHQKVDFAHPPVTSIQTRYFYRIPTHGPGKFENQFLRPLSGEVWGYVILVMLLCASVLMLSAKLEQRPSLVQYAVFSVTALFCQQSFEDNSDGQIQKSLIGRKLTLLVTGVSCLLIFNYYTSSVVSWLLSGPPPSINSLEELLESPLELIYEDIGYARSWLQTPGYYFNKRNAEIEDQIRKRKVFNRNNDTLLLSLEDGIQMMQTGGYAFHTEVNSANRLISRLFKQSELCELGSLQSMEASPLYVALQKHSPFKEFFVWSLARLSERGIISCIQRRTGYSSVKCEGSSPRALALGGAAPAFLVLAGGCVLSTCIMFLEWFYKMKEDARVTSKKLAHAQRF